ncbi:SAM-dependent methyltransferase [Spirillospora sp. CA-294931]|uniref:SAM-dependent methyltransferase n=1 Tax=Spirillospora sp. CA-294931 TaxID=3240042 RepID=UPI003D8DA83F
MTVFAIGDWTEGVPEIDLCRPNIARMSNYLLGGKDNYAADRAAVREIAEHAPEALSLAHGNREFQGRTVRSLAEEGIDQFVELGAGMPIGQGVHDVAGKAVQRPRVVYVDNDPVVVTHGRALLDNGDNVAAIEGDLRTPEVLLKHPRMQATIDFRRPVAVLCTEVLHFVRDSERPRAILRAFREVMAPGSALVLSHACADHAAPEALRAVERVYSRTGVPLVPRGRDEILRMFDGFDTVGPGLMDITRWPFAHPSPPDAALALFGGVARYRPRA